MSRKRVIAALGAGQTLAYASTYYLPAMLGVPIAHALGLPDWALFACLSGAILLAGGIGPAVGRAIDCGLGRVVLVASSLLFAAGLAVLAMATGPLALALAWALIGIGMGVGLYDAAFATLAQLYGSEARSAFTGITLIAGFASTIGWPLMAAADGLAGWRAACAGWAVLHLLLGLPLHLALPRQSAGAIAAPVAPQNAPPAPRRAMATLATAFALASLVNSGVATVLPGLLVSSGASPATALSAAALLGPAQVAARVAEFGLMRRFHPMLSARLAAIAHPLGVVALLAMGGIAAPAFALLHGAGSGMMTIAKGALPLALFGAVGYGRRQGLLGVPQSVANALAPLLFALLLARFGATSLLASAGLALLACGALLSLRATPAPGAA